MIESLHFTYNGVSSRDMGITQISTGSGLFNEQFLPRTTIVEDKVPGKDKPYYVRTEREPLSLPLSILFEHPLTDEEARKIKRWLYQDFYKPLIFESLPERIYYVKFIGESRILHNGLLEGYATLEMRCNSPYAYSPVTLSSKWDFSINGANGMEIVFDNQGDLDCFPIMYIEKVGQGDLSIVNKTTNREMKFTGLNNRENLIIDCEYEEIQTDVTGILRYSAHNDVYLYFTRGTNNLQVYGNCKIQFKYQFTLI